MKYVIAKKDPNRGNWIYYVERTKWSARQDDAQLFGASLEEVRQHLPPGLSRLERHPGDDPNIVETWL